MIQLPESVRVGHIDIRIVPWTATKSAVEKRFGEFSTVESEIRIENHDDRDPMNVLCTLMHELMHVICWVYEVRTPDKADKDETPDSEERLCGIFGTAWAQVYRDNPDLLRFIRDCTPLAVREWYLMDQDPATHDLGLKFYGAAQQRRRAEGDEL